MKVIEILNLNKELLKNFQKAGIRMDDVQYIDLFNEYRALLTQGEKCPISWRFLPPNTM